MGNEASGETASVSQFPTKTTLAILSAFTGLGAKALTLVKNYVAPIYLARMTRGGIEFLCDYTPIDDMLGVDCMWMEEPAGNFAYNHAAEICQGAAILALMAGNYLILRYGTQRQRENVDTVVHYYRVGTKKEAKDLLDGKDLDKDPLGARMPLPKK